MTPMQLDMVKESLGLVILLGTASGFLVAAIRAWANRGARITRVEERQNEAQERLQVLEELLVTTRELKVALVGIDGANGLRGEMREMRQSIKVVQEDIKTLQREQSSE